MRKRLAFLGGGLTAMTTLGWLLWEGTKTVAEQLSGEIEARFHH